jgi:hypothetical protein
MRQPPGIEIFGLDEGRNAFEPIGQEAKIVRV